MWRCANCGETIEDDGFLVCWSCGTSRALEDGGEPGAAAPPPLPGTLPDGVSLDAFASAAIHERACPDCDVLLEPGGQVVTRGDGPPLAAWACPRCRRVLLFQDGA